MSENRGVKQILWKLSLTSYLYISILFSRLFQSTWGGPNENIDFENENGYCIVRVPRQRVHMRKKVQRAKADGKREIVGR